jgi:hypothetical protein
MGALPDAQKPRAIYLEQEQIELSAVVIGANPNALMRAYQDGVIDDPFFRMISRELNRESATSATDPGKAEAARRQAHERRTERLRRIAAKF